ncbi:MAG: hypothetical protein JSW52_10895 [Candidatus Coatesbacteria bacterium]|nr:MAG: hypothetical protein JSW52_10895 [Candidatus Coatesbacteria bacterium]
MTDDAKKRVRVFLGFGPGGGRPTEFTDRVTRVGPLVRTRENAPGVPSVATFSLEITPEDDGTTAGRGTLFESETVTCEVYWTGSRSRRPPAGDRLFYGVLKGSPKSAESVVERRATLNFVGALAGLWDDAEAELFDGERRYVDLETDVLPVILTRAKLPVNGVDIQIPPVETDEPFWSPVGRPPADLLAVAEEEAAAYEVRGPAWDTARSVVYVGFGPFICYYDGSAWSVVANVGYSGGDPALKTIGWRVVYLEYDREADGLLGVAETVEGDVREHAAHVKARFAVGL